MEDLYSLGTQIIIDNKFDELYINTKLKSCLKDMNMTDMTPIQAKCIPHLLEGKDLLGAAKTGSGKTLAFLVPLVEKIMKDGVTPEHGTLGIILSPTRELSLQTFKVLEELIDGSCIRAGVVIGGNNREEEALHLNKGVNILVATPGRLLDHLNHTKPFNFNQMHTLIIDEADKLMHQGFMEEMRAIIKKLPTERQTVLFSATLSITSSKLKQTMKAKEIVKKKKLSIEDKVLTLACFSLKESCICIDLSLIDSRLMPINKIETSTVAQLSQQYVLCEADERFKILYSIIKNRSNEKVMIFMATCMEVQFYYKLLKFINESASPDTPPVLVLHGQMDQRKREKNFEQFKIESRAVLLCTDVAARGVDVPAVDLVVQYDPPDDHKEYIHRVGRTARAGKAGQALIFLRRHEMDFLSLLRDQKIPVTGHRLDQSSVIPVQAALDNIVSSVHELRDLAEAAFKSVVSAYINNPNKCFDIGLLDLASLGKNFGLVDPPPVAVSGNRLPSKKTKRRAAPSTIIGHRGPKIARNK